jgi:hypothetical protein
MALLRGWWSGGTARSVESQNLGLTIAKETEVSMSMGHNLPTLLCFGGAQ